MRPGGLVLVDNTLLHGRIFAASPDPDALAIQEFNDYVLTDGRSGDAAGRRRPHHGPRQVTADGGGIAPPPPHLQWFA
jgi:hypothetical protein